MQGLGWGAVKILSEHGLFSTELSEALRHISEPEPSLQSLCGISGQLPFPSAAPGDKESEDSGREDTLSSPPGHGLGWR